MKNITILGVTGSIGTQTLSIIKEENENFKLIAISAHTNVNMVFKIIKEYKPLYAVMTDEVSYNSLKKLCRDAKIKINILYGLDGMIRISTLEEVDMVVTSVVGMIGLIPTLAAIKSGKDIALANKETLVVGGDLVIKLAKEKGVKILPVDSEHGAIFQSLQGNDINSVSKIILTASGGPFRGKSLEELENASVESALNHPKWTMGKKISVDSATLMNKGLEVIEAHFLFNMEYDNIEVIIHPESIIHSMVEYRDGSVIAQLASTDMKLPIQYAVNYPIRRNRLVQRLDVASIGTLTFEKPDFTTFKCLALAYKCGKIGGSKPVILNAADEIAVGLFLKREIKFLQIQNIIEQCLDKFPYDKIYEVEQIIEIDSKVRNYILTNFNRR